MKLCYFSIGYEAKIAFNGVGGIISVFRVGQYVAQSAGRAGVYSLFLAGEIGSVGGLPPSRYYRPNQSEKDASVLHKLIPQNIHVLRAP